MPDAKPVNIHEAKTHFSRLIARVLKGEEVVIARSGVPVARLVPVDLPRRNRVLGMFRGQCWESPDCWDSDPEVEAALEGGFPDPFPPPVLSPGKGERKPSPTPPEEPGRPA